MLTAMEEPSVSSCRLRITATAKTFFILQRLARVGKVLRLPTRLVYPTHLRQPKALFRPELL